MRPLKIQKPKGRLRFYGLLWILMALIITRYSFMIDVPRLAFLGIILLIVATGDRNEIIAMCMCCIPLHASVDFYYAVVVCVVGYVLKYPGTIRINMSLLPVLVIIIWELLHCLGQQIQLVLFVTEMVPFFAIWMFLSTDLENIDYDFYVRSFALTTVLVGLSMVLQVLYLADFNLLMVLTELQRLGVATEETDAWGGIINPNTLGVICVLSTTALLQLRTIKREKRGDIFLIIVLLLIGILTQSRTFLICLAAMFLMLVFAQKGTIMSKIRFLLGVAAALVVVLVFLNLFIPDLLEAFYQRFLVADITTGRMDLLEIYNNYILSNTKVLFYGLGMHDLGTELTVVLRLAKVCSHNFIQEIILAWGVPGLLCMAYLLGYMVWRSRKFCRQQTLLNFIPLLILLLKSIAGQMITSGYTMMALIYAYLSLTQRFEDEKTLRQ